VGQVRLTWTDADSGWQTSDLRRRVSTRTFGAWDHNAYYQRLLLKRLPEQCGRVLDVGCGAGAFAARLADHAEHVDAVDKSAPMIEAARRRAPANVSCIHADVLKLSLPADHYDAIVSIAALHHLPLDDALRHVAPALRPGGVLAAVVLPRSDSTHEAMPKVVDPPLTTRQARDIAAATLVCGDVRRLLFWRYLLLWQRPIGL